VALRLGVEEFLPGFTGDMSVWRETASFGFVPSCVIGELTEVFAERPEEHTALLRQLGTAPNRRHAVLRNAGTLLSRWRSPAAELLPVAASWLEDPEPTVRYEAARLLGCLRAEEHADAVAVLLDDESPVFDEKVGDAAAWALARCGRQVPDLVPLLDTDHRAALLDMIDRLADDGENAEQVDPGRPRAWAKASAAIRPA
jgi:hypothetical protein